MISDHIRFKLKLLTENYLRKYSYLESKQPNSKQHIPQQIRKGNIRKYFEPNEN